MRGKVIRASQETMTTMAYQVIPKKLQGLWDEWNLRIAVLISLFFQIILIFFASERKRSGHIVIQTVIWSSYLLADWIAAFAVGLISSSQGEKCEKVTVNDELAAFWAPFLLLHLGGPDTITAFSLEDNELWLRHMLNVIVQVIAVGYVFILSLPNKFWLPTGLMFLAGTMKYAERTRALYVACLGNLKDSLRARLDPVPNQAQLMEEFSSNKAAGVPQEICRVRQPEEASGDSTEKGKRTLDDKVVIQHAYLFYNTFRGLIVDHLFSFQERNGSRKFFFSCTPHTAFRIMEVELNFMYDALFTKMAAVHNGFFSYISRFVCSALLVAAFVLFTSHHKPNIHRFDVAVTYALLGGAVILDFVALVKLVFSDWTIAFIEHSRALSIIGIQPLLKKLKVTSGTLAIHKRISFGSPWSGYMYQHNLIRYCLNKRYALLKKTAHFFALKEFFEKMMYKGKLKLDEHLQEFIFNELKNKAGTAEETKSAKDIYNARGEWTLLHYGCSPSIEQSVSEDVEYDESVLMWHIATDICYYDKDESAYDDEDTKKNRRSCKRLSDYLLYLLIMQPNLMLSVSGVASIRFRDICEEARKFFDGSWTRSDTEKACEKLTKVAAAVMPARKSLLYEAVTLAKDLKKMVDDDPMKAWEMMSKVWLELLCYGASHCRGDAHAQQLKQGGELITFVWLLMAHFGLGERFQTGYESLKLVVEK